MLTFLRSKKDRADDAAVRVRAALAVLALASSARGACRLFAAFLFVPAAAVLRPTSARRLRRAGARLGRRHGVSVTRQEVERIARLGATPLAVMEDNRLLGIIELKDTVKPGIRERFAALRRMGIRTVMITGDNPLTAAAIAAEAGVDDFLAQATPETKLKLIRDSGRWSAGGNDGGWHQRCAGGQCGQLHGRS